MPNRDANQTPPNPAASVIIPTYNRADVILQCMEHLETQTLTNFEVIIVDDGSTDATPQLLADYAARTPLRFQYVRQQNSGPATARNRAISLARGAVCIIIGDDIQPTPTFIATHLAFHQQHPAANAAALGLTVWSETGQTVTPLMRWMETGFQFDYENLRRGTKPDWRHFYTSNLSVKTELLRRHRFDERFRKAIMEDVELGYRIQASEGLDLVFLPEAVARHIHPISFTKAIKRAHEIGHVATFFDTVWPDAHPPLSPSRLKLRDLAGRNAWLLPPVTKATELLTRVWCPNPLLGPLFSLHVAAGRADAADH